MRSFAYMNNNIVKYGMKRKCTQYDDQQKNSQRLNFLNVPSSEKSAETARMYIWIVDAHFILHTMLELKKCRRKTIFHFVSSIQY